jgi:hypothetical protein
MTDTPQEIGFSIGASLGLVWWVYMTLKSGSRGGGGSAGLIFMMIFGGIGWLSGYVAAAFAHLTH